MPRTIKNLLLNYRDSIGALLVALKHPHVPMHSKMLIIIALAYALSPIDIIPDFIPILGYLDDAVIVPFLFYVAIHSIPQSVFYQCKQQAKKALVLWYWAYCLLYCSGVSWHCFSLYL